MILKKIIDIILERQIGLAVYKVHITVRRLDRLGIDYLIYAIHRDGVKLREHNYQAAKEIFKVDFSVSSVAFREEVEAQVKKWGIC